jgi:hypothetical protein
VRRDHSSDRFQASMARNRNQITLGSALRPIEVRKSGGRVSTGGLRREQRR